MICCDRCGVELAPGSLKYVFTLHVTADFDGVLPEGGELEDLEAFMRQVDAEDPVRLEEDVYQSKAYLLCPGCKRVLLQDPLGVHHGEPSVGEGGRVH